MTDKLIVVVKTTNKSESEKHFSNLFADLPDRRPVGERTLKRQRPEMEAKNFRKLTARQRAVMSVLNAAPRAYGPTELGNAVGLGYGASAQIYATAIGLFKRGMIVRQGTGRNTKYISRLWK